MEEESNAPPDIRPQLRRWAQAFPDELDGGVIDECDEHAARIEQIVRRMQGQGRWKEARVLRVEFVMCTATEAERLLRLSRLGLKMSRASYYAYLKSAHAFIEGVLLGELMTRDAAND